MLAHFTAQMFKIALLLFFKGNNVKKKLKTHFM